MQSRWVKAVGVGVLTLGALAAAAGGEVIETGDDHLSYPAASAGLILRAMEAR